MHWNSGWGGSYIARCLCGVLASGALMVLGLILAVGQATARARGRGRLALLLRQAIAGDGRSMINVGLIVLMLTPVVRVLVLAVGWAAARHWRLAGVATIVAALLAVSMALGVG